MLRSPRLSGCNYTPDTIQPCVSLAKLSLQLCTNLFAQQAELQGHSHGAVYAADVVQRHTVLREQPAMHHQHLKTRMDTRNDTTSCSANDGFMENNQSNWAHHSACTAWQYQQPQTLNPSIPCC